MMNVIEYLSEWAYRRGWMWPEDYTAWSVLVSVVLLSSFPAWKASAQDAGGYHVATGHVAYIWDHTGIVERTRTADPVGFYSPIGGHYIYWSGPAGIVGHGKTIPGHAAYLPGSFRGTRGDGVYDPQTTGGRWLDAPLNNIPQLQTNAGAGWVNRPESPDWVRDGWKPQEDLSANPQAEYFFGGGGINTSHGRTGTWTRVNTEVREGGGLKRPFMTNRVWLAGHMYGSSLTTNKDAAGNFIARDARYRVSYAQRFVLQVNVVDENERGVWNGEE